TATDEEVAAKKAEAKSQADVMSARLAAGESFSALAEEYKAEDSTVDYTDDSKTLYSDVKKANISSAYSDWLFDAARTGEENTVVESGTGYYVVQFISRGRNDYNTVNVRHILFAPVLADGESTATDEELAEAKSRAEAVLATWESGEKTADAFAALAKDNSDDTDTKDDGGLLEQVYKGETSNDLTDWIFADGRAVGDWALLQTDDGYHIVYVDSFGVPYWKLEVKSTLRQNDYNTWMEGLREKYPLGEEGFGMKFVG
ncbi:MAG TPA: peptidylprolyl isomerase, partial [Oscillospiraceae bacterium]|nr:peptidylprolyl isomerase [Oscillospiraceae bacterium]